MNLSVNMCFFKADWKMFQKIVRLNRASYSLLVRTFNLNDQTAKRECLHGLSKELDGRLPTIEQGFSTFNLNFLRTLKTSSHFMAISTKDITRGNYSQISSVDIEFFEKMLDKNQVITDPQDLVPFNSDWLKCCQGSSQLLLSPRTTEEVSTILAYCNSRGLAVCPQGGNTGLVGGSVPLFDEIILSMSRMNRVISIDPTSGVAICEGGCILDKLDQEVAKHGLMVPLDLGSRGSCQVGGNVATNAGGLRVMRYGSLHGNVLGLEAVLADGMVLDCLTSMRKDNTGYDLKQLFIGSEGTLGIVTKVCILCAARPSSINIAFLGCNSMQEVLGTFGLAKEMLGEILSAFELMDQESLLCCQTHLKIRSPIEPLNRFPFYVLLETSGSNEHHDEEKLLAFVERAIESGMVKDGGAYTQPSQIKAIWSIRERITASTLLDGEVFKYDISLPLNCIYDIVLDLRQHLGNLAKRCVGFGHVGDGNIHVNVTTPAHHANDVHQLLEPYVFQWVEAHKGSISAEHGIGLQKVSYLHHSKSRESIQMMRALKRQFDPKWILNPYKVLGF